MNAKTFLGCVISAAIGAGIAYVATKKYYEAQADNAIASVKARYSVKKEESESKEQDETPDDSDDDDHELELMKKKQLAKANYNKPDLETVVKKKHDYTQYYKHSELQSDLVDVQNEQDDSGIEPIDDEIPDDYSDHIVYIPPIDFEAIDHYTVLSWQYYADGILADETNDPVPKETIKEAVGERFMDHFGEYEDDSVYVRDDVNERYIEILRNENEYPYLVEGEDDAGDGEPTS